MNKQFIIATFAIIMTIAYIDLVDSFKYFDRIITQMLKSDVENQSKVIKAKNKLIRTQK